MSGPHRNADKVNSVAIVVVGICGAVLVYVSILALQTFYMSDTDEVNMMADYGGQDITARSLRSEQLATINQWQYNGSVDLHGVATARIAIDTAMKLVVDETTKDRDAAKNLVPALGASDVPLMEAHFGRPVTAPAAPAAPAGAGSAAAAAPTAEAAGSAAVGADVGSAGALETPTGGTAQGGGPPPGNANAGNAASGSGSGR